MFELAVSNRGSEVEAPASAEIDYEAFRQEVRDFITAHYPEDKRRLNMRQAGVFSEPALSTWWQRVLLKKGWAVPSWPVEYGGTGWDAIQRNIFTNECAAADAPRFAGQGILFLGPALMRFGTEEQKRFFLPGLMSGELYFCQGFSEPGSGSDLASLRTCAVRDGNDYVINGSKIWTTHAHYANWIFMLVRTSSDGRQQAGLSFLVAPMDRPGITVRPIISMSGEHDLNEVFFDDVRIPVANRVGEENDGWGVTKYLLEFERGLNFSADSVRPLAEAKLIARQQVDSSGEILWNNPHFRRKMAMLEIELRALGAVERSVAGKLTAGESVGHYLGAVVKIAGTELSQRATEICMDALGENALPDQRESLTLESDLPPIGPDYAAKPTARYLNFRAYSVLAGANEVMRNVIARSELGLKTS